MKSLQSHSSSAGGALAPGFTLIETIVAIALAAIMFNALWACFACGFASVRTSREDLRATQVLLQRLERLRLCTFDQIQNSGINPPSVTEYYDPQQKAAGGGGPVYTVNFSYSVPPVGSLPEAYRTNMLLVLVKTSWTSGKMPHSRAMQTYVARDGIQGYVSAGK